MKCAVNTVFTIAVMLALLGTASAQSSKPAVASRDLVRECMDLDDTLLSRKLKIEADARDDKAVLAEAQAANSQLNALQSQLNAADTAAVDAFNKKRNAQNEAGAAINARIDEHTKEVDAYNVDSRAFNEKCASVKMRIHDRRKVIKERANNLPAK